MTERSNIYGLTHECNDYECHVAAFVTTLRQMDHPADDCGLRDCPRCVKAALNILADLPRPSAWTPCSCGHPSTPTSPAPTANGAS